MKILRWWWALLLVKLVLAYLIPMGPDESYYWIWAKYPQLSYIDHPPLVSWLFWLGQSLEGFGYWVRLPAVVLGHCSLLLMYFLLRDFFDFDEDQLINWALLSWLSPFLGLGGLLVTPDIALIFFWTLSLWFFLSAMRSKKWTDYLLFGLSLGLGFCSKYHIVLLPISLLAYLSFDQRWRDVKWRFVPLTFLSGLLASLPVLIWNYQNNWASFSFQIEHGLGETKWQWWFTSDFVLGQIALLMPIGFWFYFKASMRPGNSLLKYVTWIPFGFFLLASFRGHIEGNWALTSSVFALALASSTNPGLLRRAAKWHCWFLGLISVLVVSHVMKPWIPDLRGKLTEPTELRQLAKEVEHLDPLFADTYQRASGLSFYLQKPIFKLRGASRFDFFDSLEESVPKTAPYYFVKATTAEFPQWFRVTPRPATKILTTSAGFEVWRVEEP